MRGNPLAIPTLRFNTDRTEKKKPSGLHQVHHFYAIICLSFLLFHSLSLSWDMRRKKNCVIELEKRIRYVKWEMSKHLINNNRNFLIYFSMLSPLHHSVPATFCREKRELLPRLLYVQHSTIVCKRDTTKKLFYFLYVNHTPHTLY